MRDLKQCANACILIATGSMIGCASQSVSQENSAKAPEMVTTVLETKLSPQRSEVDFSNWKREEITPPAPKDRAAMMSPASAPHDNVWARTHPRLPIVLRPRELVPGQDLAVEVTVTNAEARQEVLTLSTWVVGETSDGKVIAALAPDPVEVTLAPETSVRTMLVIPANLYIPLNAERLSLRFQAWPAETDKTLVKDWITPVLPSRIAESPAPVSHDPLQNWQRIKPSTWGRRDMSPGEGPLGFVLTESHPRLPIVLQPLKLVAGNDLVVRVTVTNADEWPAHLEIEAWVVAEQNHPEVYLALAADPHEISLAPGASFQVDLIIPAALYPPGYLEFLSLRVRARSPGVEKRTTVADMITPDWPDAKVEADLSRPLYVGFIRPVTVTIHNHTAVALHDGSLGISISSNAELDGRSHMEKTLSRIEPGKDLVLTLPVRGTRVGESAISLVASSPEFHQSGYMKFTVAWCPADFNQDGKLDDNDQLAFEKAIADADPRADLNKDGIIGDPDDLAIFRARTAAGCD